jgi:hypothetical protein
MEDVLAPQRVANARMEGIIRRALKAAGLLPKG